MRESNKRWRVKNPDKVKAYHLKKKFGISLLEYNQLLKNQDGVCSICKEREPKKDLAVDHSHKTGRVRGLLCERCNRGLGMFRDNKDFLLQAFEYLKTE